MAWTVLGPPGGCLGRGDHGEARATPGPREVRAPGLWLGGFFCLAALQAVAFLGVLTRNLPLGFLVGGWGALLSIPVVLLLALVDGLVDDKLARIGRGEVPGLALRRRGAMVEVVEVREVGTFREPSERVLVVVTVASKRGGGGEVVSRTQPSEVETKRQS